MRNCDLPNLAPVRLILPQLSEFYQICDVRLVLFDRSEGAKQPTGERRRTTATDTNVISARSSMQAVAVAALALSLFELSSAACCAPLAAGALPARGRAASRAAAAAATPLLRATASRSPSPDPGDRDTSADSRRSFRLCLDEDSADADTLPRDFTLRK